MSDLQKDISHAIGRLMETGFKFSNPVSQLHLIRDKINVRGYKSFDKADILDELGRMQHTAGELHERMLKVYDLLKTKAGVL